MASYQCGDLEEVVTQCWSWAGSGDLFSVVGKRILWHDDWSDERIVDTDISIISASTGLSCGHHQYLHTTQVGTVRAVRTNFLTNVKPRWNIEIILSQLVTFSHGVTWHQHEWSPSERATTSNCGLDTDNVFSSLTNPWSMFPISI